MSDDRLAAADTILSRLRNARGTNDLGQLRAPDERAAADRVEGAARGGGALGGGG
jgi:hypothetical protein